MACHRVRVVSYPCLVSVSVLLRYCIPQIKSYSQRYKQQSDLLQRNRTWKKLTGIFISWPSVWWSNKILIFNINEMLCRSDSLDICHFNAFLNSQVFCTNKVLQPQANDIWTSIFIQNYLLSKMGRKKTILNWEPATRRDGHLLEIL